MCAVVVCRGRLVFCDVKEVYLGGNELEMLSGDWLKDAASVVLLDIRENGITV